jgi:hypothetical protein
MKPPAKAAKVAIVAPRKATIDEVAPMPVARGAFKKREPRPWYKEYAVHMGVGGGVIVLVLLFFLVIKPGVAPTPPPPPPPKEVYTPPPPAPDPELVRMAAVGKTVIELDGMGHLPPLFTGRGVNVVIFMADGTIREFDGESGKQLQHYDFDEDNGGAQLKGLNPKAWAACGSSGYIGLLGDTRMAFLDTNRGEGAGSHVIVNIDPEKRMTATTMEFQYDPKGKLETVVVGDNRGNIHFVEPQDSRGFSWRERAAPRKLVAEPDAINTLANAGEFDSVFVGFQGGALFEHTRAQETRQHTATNRRPIVRMSMERSTPGQRARLLVVDEAGKAELWKTGENPSMTLALSDVMHRAVIANDRSYVAGRDAQGQLAIWDLEKNQKKHLVLPDVVPDTNPPPGVLVPSWHPGPGTWAIMARVDGRKVILWKLGWAH